MSEREKIIKGLECCRIQQNEVPPICEACPYADDAWGTCEDMSGLLNDAYEMLKAQEPVEPVPTLDDDWACGLCERSVVGCEELDDGSFRPVKYNFCQHCGRPVKWG